LQKKRRCPWLLPKFKKEIKEVMDYTFDTIKSRWVLALIFIFIIIFPLIPFTLLNVRAWFPIPPSIFISFVIPISISVLASLIIARNKQKLFWTKMHLSLDGEKCILKINQKQYSFNTLEYYHGSFGSPLTSGSDRLTLFLKFKGEKGKTIMPCKTSTEIEYYDSFLKEFDRIIVENKLKPFGFKRILKPLVYISATVSIAAFPITYFIDGPKIASKLLPLYLILTILIVFIVGMRYLIKKT